MNDIPTEIIDAANLISLYMKKNGHYYWQLGDICCRKFALNPPYKTIQDVINSNCIGKEIEIRKPKLGGTFQ